MAFPLQMQMLLNGQIWPPQMFLGPQNGALVPVSSLSPGGASLRGPLGGSSTKDIAVRGIARPVRKSYLSESTKFETDLVKYLGGKSKTDVPDHVVDLLFTYINEDSYVNLSPLDEVTLCILASNVSAKSVVDYSVKNLKKIDSQLNNTKELVKIIACMLLSSKVDSKLHGWLKGFVEQRDSAYVYGQLYSCAHWHELNQNHPQIKLDFLELMGWITPRDSSRWRQL